ncbi:MAG: S1C family serine protease [Polyangiaceae bacterium]
MKTPFLFSTALALACVAVPASAQQPAPRPLPALPGRYAAPPPAAVAAPAMPSAQELYERVRKGVVAIERNGVPTAIGTVLGGDVRILTALSGLGGAECADVRYADGTTVHTKVGHADKDTDLALLVPLAGKWKEGLSASETDPIGAWVHAMLPGKVAHLGPADAAVKGRVDAHARDGAALLQMLDVDLKGPAIAGAPLLDATGNVVGVLVRACKGTLPQPVDSPWAAWGAAAQTAPKAACNPVVLGEPVNAIRSFLSRTPATAVTPSPWLGIRGEEQPAGGRKGVRLIAVAPGSPADRAGLKANTDVIVAVDGAPVESPDGLADTIGRHAPGDSVKLLVLGGGKFRDVTVVLRAAP